MILIRCACCGIIFRVEKDGTAYCPMCVCGDHLQRDNYCQFIELKKLGYIS
jgi:hypothetical protein